MASVVGLLTVAVPVAWASHQFTDVPDSNPFHSDIAAVKDAGITQGKTCTPPGTPPTYCPSESITREAMAAFLHRGSGRVAYAALPQTAVPATETALYTFQITPGIPAGASGATGFVKVDAKLNFTLTDGATCQCDYYARIAATGSGYAESTYSTITLYNTLDVATVPLTGAIPVTSSAPVTVEIRVFRFTGSGGGTGPATVSGDATATYYPFGATGANSLGEVVTANTAQQQLRERSAAEKAGRHRDSP